MNSEKVKEIKEKLQEEIFIANSFGDKLRKVPTKELENLLTLINELESENERLRLERDVLIGKKIAEKQKHDKAIIMKIDIQKQLKNRIAELEDLIEKGLLVPRYSISQDWQYGWWCVCEVDEQSRIIAQCKTEEEAKRKLEELTNEQIYNTVMFN